MLIFKLNKACKVKEERSKESQSLQMYRALVNSSSSLSLQEIDFICLNRFEERFVLDFSRYG